MGLREHRDATPTGLFDDPEIMGIIGQLREEATSAPTNELIAQVENAGVMFLIDPEKAVDDSTNTLAKVDIALEAGIEVIEFGGSTNEADPKAVAALAYLIRHKIEASGTNTKFIGFPGTADQVMEGLHGVYALIMPQMHDVFMGSQELAAYFKGQFRGIVGRGNDLGIPVVPLTYVLFNGGKPTTVERQTGVRAIDIVHGVDTEGIMHQIAPWIEPEDFVRLELGSNPETFSNLGPVAFEVQSVTGRTPIISGGVNSTDNVCEIGQVISSPLGVGTKFESMTPSEFREAYPRFKAVYNATRA